MKIFKFGSYVRYDQGPDSWNHKNLNLGSVKNPSFRVDLSY